MSAPRKIWADTASMGWVEAYPGQRMNPCEEVYHRDDVVRELVEAAKAAKIRLQYCADAFTDQGSQSQSDACDEAAGRLMAALAKIAQEDRG